MRRLRPGVRADGVRQLVDYDAALALLDDLAARPADADDVLIALEHPPTITVGRRGGAEMVAPEARAAGTRVVEIARGGSVTWHGPGQLVIYPVVQLARLAPPLGRPPLGDLPLFVRTLESAILATCAAFGVAARQREGFSGVWIDDRRKLASIGIGLRNGWTTHGLALNVADAIDGFGAIVPCGLAGVAMTSLAAEARAVGLPAPPLPEVEATLLAQLEAALVRRTS